LDNFSSRFGDQDLQSVTPDQILTFLVQITEGQKQATKRFKYILLKTLFNFIKNSTDSSFVNPCDSSILKKTFRHSKGRQWTIIEKDVMDEIIFKTDNPRNRLMLELMARGGMRIGEVLKLRVMDVEDCKLFLINPKSGRQNEVVFIPKKGGHYFKDQGNVAWVKGVSIPMVLGKSKVSIGWHVIGDLGWTWFDPGQYRIFKLATLEEFEAIRSSTNQQETLPTVSDAIAFLTETFREFR